jgi:hypothetical protein
MIPVIKGWMTEVGVELTSLGVQVHGGMGYVEETGAAQFWRDVRITPIYEGTNGIQAADLVGRKLARDGGDAMGAVLGELQETAAQLQATDDSSLQAIGAALDAAARRHIEVTEQLLAWLAAQPEAAQGAAFDYMMQTGYLFGGWQLARSALVAQRALAGGSDRDFYARKIATALFYAQNVLPRCEAHAGSIAGAGSALQNYPVDWL